jgi:peroxiredoxin
VRALNGVLILILLVACGSGDPSTPVEPGDVLEPQEDARELAPDFSLESISGGTVSLSDLRGRVVIIDFWATWCPPCEFQIPILNEVYAAHPNGEVEILGISVDTEGAEKVREYIRKHDARYPILMGDEALARRFGAPGFPSLIVIDPEGRIEGVHVGLIEAPDLEQFIAAAARAFPALTSGDGPA